MGQGNSSGKGPGNNNGNGSVSADDAWLLAASSPTFGDWAQQAVQGRQSACHGKSAAAQGAATACSDRDVFIVRYGGRPVDVDLALVHPSLRYALAADTTLYFRAMVDQRGSVVIVQPLYTADSTAERPLVDFVTSNLRVTSNGPSSGTMQVFGAVTALTGGNVAVTLAGAWAAGS
jgi:hypothetical protein